MQPKRQTMWPPAYYQSSNGPIVTHALGYMIYGFDYIYITLILLPWDLSTLCVMSHF